MKIIEYFQKKNIFEKILKSKFQFKFKLEMAGKK